MCAEPVVPFLALRTPYLLLTRSTEVIRTSSEPSLMVSFFSNFLVLVGSEILIKVLSPVTEVVPRATDRDVA